MQPALEAAALTAADHEHIRLRRACEDEAERRRVDELLASEAMILRLPAFLAHPLVVSFLVGMTAVLGLFLFSQINTTLVALASLSDGWRYAGYCGLALLTACLLFAMGRCVVFYFGYGQIAR